MYSEELQESYEHSYPSKEGVGKFNYFHFPIIYCQWAYSLWYNHLHNMSCGFDGLKYENN